MKRLRSILFLLVTTLLFGVAPARAYLLAVEVLWQGAPPFGGIPSEDPEDPGIPNTLVIGSIIQLVAYNSTQEGVNPPPTPSPNPALEENFEHYGSSLIPDTTPDGHHIVGSGNLHELTEYGGGVYGMTAIIDVPDAYDTVYVRVFSATNFVLGVASNNVHWGISGTNHIDTTFGTALAWFNDVAATNVANFELIPEPSSLAFLLSGGCGMGVFSLFRRRRKLRPPEE